MTITRFILTAIFGPDDTRTLEQAEADYIAARARYDACVGRGDDRGAGQARAVLNRALNHMLSVECGQRRARLGLWL